MIGLGALQNVRFFYKLLMRTVPPSFARAWQHLLKEGLGEVKTLVCAELGRYVLTRVL